MSFHKTKKAADFSRKIIKLILFLYLFIFSIEMIKRAAFLVAPNIKDFLLQNLTPIKALCVGWFTTSVIQSSGAMASLTATFAGANLINLSTVVFVLIGAALGTTITALIISLITLTKKRRDFRHGFEIGLCYTLYGIMIGGLVFILEYFFKIFSRLSLFLASRIQGKISLLKVPDLIKFLTAPIMDPLFARNNNLFLLIFGFALLIVALRYISKSIIEVLGGERKARESINKYFDSKYKAYCIGILLTAIVFSSSITIGLLVPLAVARLINLKKAIPFILGADIGTFTDVFLASVIIGQVPALATAITYFLFSLLGSLIFLPNTEYLFKITKYTSKRLIHISRKKALYVLLAFILIPLFVIFVF
jgi:sodium-dependent phosphate cotransporter